MLSELFPHHVSFACLFIIESLKAVLGAVSKTAPFSSTTCTKSPLAERYQHLRYTPCCTAVPCTPVLDPMPICFECHALSVSQVCPLQAHMMSVTLTHQSPLTLSLFACPVHHVPCVLGHLRVAHVLTGGQTV